MCDTFSSHNYFPPSFSFDFLFFVSGFLTGSVFFSAGSFFISGGSSGFYVTGSGNRFTRVHAHDSGSDSGKVNGQNTIIEYSLIEKPGADGDCVGHVDMPQMGTGGDASGSIVRYNTIEGQLCPCTGSGAGIYHASQTFLTEDDAGGTGDIYFTGNWLNGGAGVLWGGAVDFATVLQDNRIGTYYHATQALCNGNMDWSPGGNVWDCDGSPVTSCAATRPACKVPTPGTCPGTSIYPGRINP